MNQGNWTKLKLVQIEKETKLKRKSIFQLNQGKPFSK